MLLSSYISGSAGCGLSVAINCIQVRAFRDMFVLWRHVGFKHCFVCNDVLINAYMCACNAVARAFVFATCFLAWVGAFVRRRGLLIPFAFGFARCRMIRSHLSDNRLLYLVTKAFVRNGSSIVKDRVISTMGL